MGAALAATAASDAASAPASAVLAPGLVVGCSVRISCSGGIEGSGALVADSRAGSSIQRAQAKNATLSDSSAMNTRRTVGFYAN